MKKLAAFSLLAVFLFNSVGYYVAFSISRTAIRKEIKTKIKLNVPEQDLTAIEIPKSDVSYILWEKEGKEFFYHNKFFDVVRKKETMNSVIFYCIDDEQESRLFSLLDRHVDAQIMALNSKNESPSKKINDHVLKVYYTNDFRFEFYNSFTLLNFLIPLQNMLSEFSEPKSPPPEFT